MDTPCLSVLLISGAEQSHLQTLLKANPDFNVVKICFSSSPMAEQNKLERLPLQVFWQEWEV
jgi:hypothetical protein